MQETCNADWAHKQISTPQSEESMRTSQSTPTTLRVLVGGPRKSSLHVHELVQLPSADKLQERSREEWRMRNGLSGNRRRDSSSTSVTLNLFSFLVYLNGYSRHRH